MKEFLRTGLPDTYDRDRQISFHEDFFVRKVDLSLFKESFVATLIVPSSDVGSVGEVSFYYDPKPNAPYGMQLPGTSYIKLNIARLPDIEKVYVNQYRVSEVVAKEMSIVRIAMHEQWHVDADDMLGSSGFESLVYSGSEFNIEWRGLNEAVTELLTQMSFEKYIARKFGLRVHEQSILYKGYARLVREVFYLVADLDYVNKHSHLKPNEHFTAFWTRIMHVYLSKDVVKKSTLLDEFTEIFGSEFMFILNKFGCDSGFKDQEEEGKILNITLEYVKLLRQSKGLGDRQSFTLNL